MNDRGNDLSKQWYVEYMYLHPEKNVLVPFRKYISLKLKTGAARRMKADKLIIEFNEWLAMGGNPFANENLERTGLVEALDRLYKLKVASTRKRTQTTYKDTINKVGEFLRIRKLLDIAVEDVSNILAQQFCDYMIQDLHLSNRTHNNHLNNLRSLWNMMKKRFSIHNNPWSGVDMLEEEEPSNVMFTDKELNIIHTNLPKDNFELWCCAGLVFYCALRPQEIVRLQAYNIRLDKKAIMLDGRITKNKKTRWVNIPSDSFIEDLERLKIEDMHPNLFVFGSGLKPGRTEISPTRIAEKWAIWREKYNIRHTIYNLKHNAVGMLADAGASSRDIQLHIRHHSLTESEAYMNRFRTSVGPGFKDKYPKL